MSMTLKMQQKPTTTKPLSPKAIPFSPSSLSTVTTTSSQPSNYNLIYFPHQLYPPPPPPPSPVRVVVPPTVLPVFFYTTVRSYQPLRYHHNNIKITPFQHHNPTQSFNFCSHLRFCNPNPNPNFYSSSIKPPVTENCISNGGVGSKVSGDGDNHELVEKSEVFNKVGFRKRCYRPIPKPVNRKSSNRVVKEYRVQKNGALYGHKTRVSDFHDYRGITTVMFRNIPNKLRRDELLAILDEHCRLENEKAKAKSDGDRVISAFDFVYLPIDFRNLGNKGYAFVNFTTSVAATRFREAMMSKNWVDCIDSKKQCDFSVARIQGLNALVQHFNESRFPTKTEEYLPVVLSPAHDGMTPGSVPRLVGKCYV